MSEANIKAYAKDKPERLHISSTRLTVAWYSRVISGQHPKVSAGSPPTHSRKPSILNMLNFQTNKNITIATSKSTCNIVMRKIKVDPIAGKRSSQHVRHNKTKHAIHTVDLMKDRSVSPEAFFNAARSSSSNSALRTNPVTLKMNGM
eukprot:CAMPEP_0198513150 /NCGR_PEP_ID=MMETSP1462-20131121/15885_1 /TAXON_ID=1333877 /ORGANISM="Brandtodinium nutriculum, Strain RCC3387" /LENGTH=146 /DNA_ID=CAMNT_0044242571 /DNA_START=170 /DNA_END=610 /DNA_ORIENTATION=-